MYEKVCVKVCHFWQCVSKHAAILCHVRHCLSPRILTSFVGKPVSEIIACQTSLRDGLFCIAEWAVSRSEMGRFAMRFGPFCNTLCIKLL